MLRNLLFQANCWSWDVEEGRGVELLAPLADEYIAIDKIQEVIDNLKQEHPGVDFRQGVFSSSSI